MSIANSWISKKPQRCGGTACVGDTRITVWGLVEWRRLGRSDGDILRALPDLTVEDLAAAWEYAATHNNEIELALWQNEACMYEQNGGQLPSKLVARGRSLGLNDEEIRNAFEPPSPGFGVPHPGA